MKVVVETVMFTVACEKSGGHHRGKRVAEYAVRPEQQTDAVTYYSCAQHLSYYVASVCRDAVAQRLFDGTND